MPPPDATRARPTSDEKTNSLLNRLWLTNAAVDLYKTVGNATLPGFAWGVKVLVAGGPEASMRRIWYLALAAAFGRLRNAPQTAFQQMDVSSVWDLSNKTVSVEISYTINKLENFARENVVATAIAVGALFVPGGLLVKSALALGGIAVANGSSTPLISSDRVLGYLHRGPEQLTVGATWPRWLTNGQNPSTVNLPLQSSKSWSYVKACPNIIGVGGSTVNAPFKVTRTLAKGPVGETPFFNTDGSYASFPYTVIGLPGMTIPLARMLTSTVPQLPDNGRIILTQDKSNPLLAPPAPPIDGETRGSLVDLVSQNLSSPCFLPAAPPCQSPTLAASGLQVYPVSINAGSAALNATLKPLQTATFGQPINPVSSLPAFSSNVVSE